MANEDPRLNGTNFTGEPLTKNVGLALSFEQSGLTDLLGTAKLTPQEKKMDLNELILTKAMSDPSKLTESNLRQTIAEPVKTIILSTGLDYEQIRAHPAPLKLLFEKSKDALGGTASDFFLELGIDTSTAQKARLALMADVMKQTTPPEIPE